MAPIIRVAAAQGGEQQRGVRVGGVGCLPSGDIPDRVHAHVDAGVLYTRHESVEDLSVNLAPREHGSTTTPSRV